MDGVKALVGERTEMVVYPLLLVCQTTGAIHIQVAHDYSMSGFMIQWNQFFCTRQTHQGDERSRRPADLFRQLHQKQLAQLGAGEKAKRQKKHNLVVCPLWIPVGEPAHRDTYEGLQEDA